MTFERSKGRIAKNTLMLYCRMVLTMVVSLYTSRVVLNALGVTDYGVYNVVGGVVTMLSFFSSSIISSTQRFLNVGMANQSYHSLQNIFSTSINVHIIIGVVTVILLETVGLWFVVNRLVIPETQYTAALWVYQCSILSFFITIISAPYNAAIIAYERMSAFAVLSIVEVFLKLAVAFALMHYVGSRLTLYAILLLCTTMIMRFLYGAYCSRSFEELQFKFVWIPKLIKEMMAFSAWMIFGCIADLLGTQGVNMMINIFFGPIFNAARAIAVQVQAAVAQFSNNFIISVNPQIVKSYAAGDYQYSYNLVFTASKISFFLMMMIVIPIILRAEQILSIWLSTVPPEASIFMIIVLIEYLIRSSYTPLAQINQASGNIRAYQLSIAVLFLLNFVVTYILFKVGFPVYSTFIVSAIIAVIGLLVRIIVLKVQQQFPAYEYLTNVSIRVCMVAIPAFIISFLINTVLTDNFGGLVLNTVQSMTVSATLIWIIGLNKPERQFIIAKLTMLRNRLLSH